MKDLREFFNQTTKKLDEKLDELLPKETIEPQRLHQAVRWSIFAGGKRFRPALMMAVGRVFKVEEERLWRTASAVEMIHTYSLIHDDLPAMDDDDLRRGRKTCHLKFDEATAILAGDVLQTLAFQTIAEDESLTSSVRVKLVSELARLSGTPLGMVAGQQLDIEAEGKNIKLEELEKIHRSKTGALISFSAVSGARIAGADLAELQIIEKYAALLGLLFQITDDLLDVTQTTEVLGKTAGKDVKAEKATYPAFYGVSETRNLAENIYGEILEELKKLKKDTEILSQIAEFILNRQS